MEDNLIVRNADAIRDIFKRASRRREIAILVTPYVKFETNLLWCDEDTFHVTATMSKEDAQYGLKTPNLKVRFPHGHRIFSASTRVLGIGQVHGRQSLRLQMPTSLENDDFRRAYRVEKVGRVQVTFSSRNYDLLTGSLSNLSTGGARIFSSKDLEEGEILEGDTIHVTIPLTPEISLNTKAKVRHVKERGCGLEFTPPLSGKLLDALSRWTFQKREESLATFTEKEEGGAEAPANELLNLGGAPLLALVGGTSELEGQLQAQFSDLLVLQRFPANVQSMRALAATPNTVVLFYVETAAMEARKRMGMLLEPLQQSKVPFFLVGTSVEASTLMALANEWKAVMGCALGPQGNRLLARMVAGAFKKQGNPA